MMKLGTSETYQNRRSDGHTLFTGTHKFLSAPSPFIANSGEIWH